jgi:uncharacterized membrane protein
MLNQKYNIVFRTAIPGVALSILAVLVYVGTPFWWTILSVLSGNSFLLRWEPRFAGIALDQPTIGKYFFWFTLTAVFVLTASAGLLRLVDRKNPLGYWLFAVPFICLWILLFFMLAHPAILLVKYIVAMGWTAKRFIAVLYVISWLVFLLGFLRCVVKSPKQSSE